MWSPMTAPPPDPRPRRLLPAGILSPKSLCCFLLVATLGLTADLWLKSYAWQRLVTEVSFYDGVASLSRRDADLIDPAAGDVVLVPHLLELTAVANQGAAMGLGQGHRTIFLVVSVAAVAVLFYFYAFSGRRRVYQVVLGLLLAGVLGNLYDRVAFGYVRDMLHLFPGVRWSDLASALPRAELFPWVFNLADCYLCVGVPAVLLQSLLVPAAPRTAAAAVAADTTDVRPAAEPAGEVL